MNFKNENCFTWLCFFLLLGLVVSCKPKVSDADIKARVEQETEGNPNVVVAVKKGEVTLSGIVETEEERRKLTEAVKSADSQNIKSVVDDLTVATIPEKTSPTDQELRTKVDLIIKEFSDITANVEEGIIKVSGEIEQSEVRKLKIALDELNPSKVDMSLLTVK